MNQILIRPIATHLPLHKFVNEHGVEAAETILKGAPKAATLFVYAYVAKSIDYLRIDEDGNWLLFSNNIWKPLTTMVVQSFHDIAYSLENLKIAVKSANHE